MQIIKVGACVAVAVLLGAACGKSEPFSEATGRSHPSGGTPQARLLAAITSTTSENTARLAMNVAVTGADATSGDDSSSTDETLSGDGTVDFAHHAVDVKLTSANDESKLEVRIVGGKVYVNEGDSWTSVSDAELSASPINQSFDPNEYLDYLRQIAPDAHAVGTETLRGTETTHFQGTVDVAGALSKSALGSSLQQQVKSALGGAVPVDAWIDGDGHVRKVALSLSVLGMKMAESVEFYDFGTPVTITAPANPQSAAGRAQDRAAQSDLRNALTAEKTVYTDNQTYTADPAEMKQVETSLDWGGKLTVVVGDATSPGDRGVVCVAEASKSGTTFSLGDVAAGTRAGTYYGKRPCPVAATPQNISELGPSW